MPGDGIGPELFKKIIPYLNHIAKKFGKEIEWIEAPLGLAYGPAVPKETIELLKKYRGIKGPLGTPIGGGHRSYNVQLRIELGLDTCIRPVVYFEGIPSMLRMPELVDMVVFRQNTEDLYMGIEIADATPDQLSQLEILFGRTENTLSREKTWNTSLKPISKEGSEDIVRQAVEYALAKKLPTVTLMHKGNIMKATEGRFRNYGYDLVETQWPDLVFTQRQYEAKEKEYEERFGKGTPTAREALRAWWQEQKETKKLYVQDVISDNMFQQIILNPEQHNVIATMNLNGDYISDGLAATVGGVGISPGVNKNSKTGWSVYEATHGTAPRIVDMDLANPSSILLSAEMYFHDIGWHDVGYHINNDLRRTFKQQKFTSDFADVYEKIHKGEKMKHLTTTEFMEELMHGKEAYA